MKNCKNCNFFKPVYRHWRYGLSHSLTFPLHYCALTEQMIKRENCCGSWQCRQSGEYDISPERLAQAEEDIRAIIAMLGEFS